jgi:hypothetical protein
VKLSTFGLVLCLTATGCGKITQSNYDKVSLGMSLADVEKILGKGTETASLDLSKIVNPEPPSSGPNKQGAQPSGPAMSAVMPGMVNPADLLSAKWIKWGDEKKYILLAFTRDKVVWKSSEGL